PVRRNGDSRNRWIGDEELDAAIEHGARRPALQRDRRHPESGVSAEWNAVDDLPPRELRVVRGIELLIRVDRVRWPDLNLRTDANTRAVDLLKHQRAARREENDGELAASREQLQIVADHGRSCGRVAELLQVLIEACEDERNIVVAPSDADDRAVPCNGTRGAVRKRTLVRSFLIIVRAVRAMSSDSGCEQSGSKDDSRLFLKSHPPRPPT